MHFAKSILINCVLDRGILNLIVPNKELSSIPIFNPHDIILAQVTSGLHFYQF